jgi:hypothetical protein
MKSERGGKAMAVNIQNLGSGQQHAPAALSPDKWRGTHCTGGRVGLGAGLDGCGKSSHRDMNPGPSSPWGIAVPTELSRPPWTDLHAFLKQHTYKTSKRVVINVGRIQLCLSKSRVVINILVIKVNGISMNGLAWISFLPPAWSVSGCGAVTFFFSSYCDLSVAVSMTVRINLVLCVRACVGACVCVCVCVCWMTRMPSVHHLYALVAWCSICHLLLLHFSFLNEEFFKVVPSFIDLKIQVQTRGSLVLARKDLGPNL